MFPLANSSQYVDQEDDDCRGGGARLPMPFTMVSMTDSEELRQFPGKGVDGGWEVPSPLVDLKISLSRFHPNHTAPDKNKNKIPNGFSR
jgi:hypothetical protein